MKTTITTQTTMRRINPAFPQPGPFGGLVVDRTPPTFKPKKAGTKTAHVVFLLDDSASMSSVRVATIDGFNEFLKGQQESEVLTFVSLYKFDGTNVNCVFSLIEADSVDPLTRATYNPRGMTNLLDGMGCAMTKINKHLASEKKKQRPSVNLVVLTDGHENASRSYTSQDIKQMVELAEGKEWSFMFLGANIDAFSAGMNLGFRAENTLQYDTKNIGGTMKSASRMSADMSMMKSRGVATSMAYTSAQFTDEEREDAV